MHFTKLTKRFLISQAFYMRFGNGVDENFQHDFVINIGYCITNVKSRRVLPYKITVFVTTVILFMTKCC